jgi:dTMP kinase
LSEAALKFGLNVEEVSSLLLRSDEVLKDKRSGAYFIAFEGIDGSGKTLQVKMLEHHLSQVNASVATLSCPSYREFFGKEVSRLLSGREEVNANNLDAKSMALWYALDRAQLTADLRTKPENGVVLFNRYTLSSAVYQSVRSGSDISDWIFELEHTHLKIPSPDLYIVLDVSPAISQRNMSRRRRAEGAQPGLDVYEQSQSLLKAARERYLELARQLPCVEVIECMVDSETMKSSENIHKEVLSCLSRHHLYSTTR